MTDSSSAPHSRPEITVSKAAWVAPLVFFALFLPLLAFRYADTSTLTLVGATAILAVLLPAALILHELGHALAAHRLGLPIIKIRFSVVGAAVVIDVPEDYPTRRNVVITAAGPSVNLLLAALLTIPGLFTDSVVTEALAFAALANLVLGISNLLPYYPLDGYRILRAFHTKLPKVVAPAAWAASAVSVALSFLGILPDFALRPWLILLLITPLTTLPLRPFVKRLEKTSPDEVALTDPATS